MSGDDELVERVAKAIFQSDLKWAPIFEHQYQENRQMYFAAANAAIAVVQAYGEELMDRYSITVGLPKKQKTL